LNATQLDWAHVHGIVEIPSIPTSQLEKLDKGGALFKAFAIGKVAYLIAQLISRWPAGLPCSQLEINTLAFAISSGITYVLYWSKPQGVETTHVLKANPRAAEFVASTTT